MRPLCLMVTALKLKIWNVSQQEQQEQQQEQQQLLNS